MLAAQAIVEFSQSGAVKLEQITKIRSRGDRVSLEETSQFARTVLSNLL